MLPGVRGSVAYPFSTRQVAERMRDRGVLVDHATITRGVIRYSPLRAEACHRRQRPVGRSWRMAATCIRVKGAWRSLYRAVDQYGQPLDFRLTEPRDPEAARRVLKPARHRHGVPDQLTLDGSAAHEAAIKRDHEAHGTAIDIRQIQSLNNMVEPDPRGVKRLTRPMLGCKSFAAAPAIRVGIALKPMLTKSHRGAEDTVEGLTSAEPFYALAASSLPQQA
jgi:transposase-like protein